MIAHGIDLDSEAIREFCRKWKIKELSVFGSILRDDFGPLSDIDFLVEFERSAAWGFEERMDLEEELERIVGRPVDVSTKSGLKWVIRERVLRSARVIHAA
jgi:predicted nucleotidyltransferase